MEQDGINELKRQLEQSQSKIETLQKEMAELYESRSWKITKPVRDVGQFARKIKHKILNRRRTFYFKPRISFAGIPEDNSLCTIFASYSSDGTIPEYVVYYLKELKKNSQFIIFVADNNLKKKSELKKIKSIVNVAIFGRHGGYDFNSFKIGYNYICKKSFSKKFSDFLFVNDSCYGPMYDLTKVYNEMKSRKADFWGLIDSTDGVYHLLSFFLNCNKKVFFSKELEQFFYSLPAKMTFEEAVNKGEKEFTKTLMESFQCGCYLPKFSTGNARSYIGGNRNSTVWPLSLLKAGFPLVKVKALTGEFGNQLNEPISDTMIYIYKNNKALYEIIIGDLKRRFGIVPKECFFSPNGEDLTFVLKENINVVSFDIFDTLLIRPFANPTDLFLLIEKDHNLQGFATKRIEAEKRAREKSKFQEINIDEIYENIAPEFAFAKNLELDYEKRLLRKNPAIEKIYSQACDSNKKIIAISDMYLGKDFLKEILYNNGFNQISEVFVSSDLRKTKGSGDIYRAAISKCGIKAENMLHIGDNEVADVQIPSSMGINAILISRIIDRFLTPGNAKWINYYNENKTLGKGIQLSLIAKHVFNEKEHNIPYWEMMGYRIAMGIVSYLNFILKESKEHGIDRLIFVARDGWILKKLYEEFFMDIYGIPCSYAYLTRVIGLEATLDFNQEPAYLKKLLQEASKNVKGITISDDYETNLHEFKIYEDAIKKWSAHKKTEFEKHLNAMAGEAKRIALVDATTGRFSSLRFAKSILGNRVYTAFFTGTFDERPEYSYSTFSKRGFTGIDDWKLMFMEEFFSSPFPSAISLENGEPVLEMEDDSFRRTIYLQITKGIVDYVHDLINLFGKNINSICITFEDFFNMFKWYKMNMNLIDLEELSHLKHKDLMRGEEFDLTS
ncbi:MAG: HAD-IA family hydrolase [Treponema sp.]|nr:HAD-IA family hydrolase [Treponema sp.]